MVTKYTMNAQQDSNSFHRHFFQLHSHALHISVAAHAFMSVPHVRPHCTRYCTPTSRHMSVQKAHYMISGHELNPQSHISAACMRYNLLILPISMEAAHVCRISLAQHSPLALSSSPLQLTRMPTEPTTCQPNIIR